VIRNTICVDLTKDRKGDNSDVDKKSSISMQAKEKLPPMCSTIRQWAHAELIPVGRFATTDEVADVVVMMSKNGNIAEQTINVNGRWYMS
jgi:hypothetical protein